MSDQVITFCGAFACHDILGKVPIKWRQRPDMTIAFEWAIVKYKSNKQIKLHTYDIKST